MRVSAVGRLDNTGDSRDRRTPVGQHTDEPAVCKVVLHAVLGQVCQAETGHYTILPMHDELTRLMAYRPKAFVWGGIFVGVTTHLVADDAFGNGRDGA